MRDTTGVNYNHFLVLKVLCEVLLRNIESVNSLSLMKYKSVSTTQSVNLTLKSVDQYSHWPSIKYNSVSVDVTLENLLCADYLCFYSLWNVHLENTFSKALWARGFILWQIKSNGIKSTSQIMFSPLSKRTRAVTRRKKHNPPPKKNILCSSASKVSVPFHPLCSMFICLAGR